MARWTTFTSPTLSSLSRVRPGLPIVPTSIRKNFAYHKNAVGHASGADVTTELNYIPEKVAHLGTSYMSQGAVLIDNTGVYEVQAYDI